MMIEYRESDWEGLDDFDTEVLEELRPSVQRTFTRVLRHLVNAVKKTLSGRRSGRSYRYRGRTHIAAAPGEPPAVRSGALRNSITHTDPQWQGFVLSAEVGSGLPYARRQEFGGVDSRGVYIPPHPYMAPTLEREAPVIDRMLEDV